MHHLNQVWILAVVNLRIRLFLTVGYVVSCVLLNPNDLSRFGSLTSLRVVLYAIELLGEGRSCVDYRLSETGIIRHSVS